MSKVLTGRIRKVGNSMAVIIPKELLEEAGAKEGDSIRLSVAIPPSRRESTLRAIAGLDRGKSAFRREKTDRY